MNSPDQKKEWERFREQELATITPLLEHLGYTLEERQPHITGERYLMQAVTTAHGKKLILLGERKSDGKRVVIKIATDEKGVHELAHERLCRAVLSKINFAYHTFYSPEEILFTTQGAYTISIQAFLTQESPFLERPIEEQFQLALSSFKAQEGTHATTHAHINLAKKTFGSRGEQDYLSNFSQFQENIVTHLPEGTAIATLLQESRDTLFRHAETIERYSGFLTHTDFVPHNFRIQQGKIFLLDHSSIIFGNKYEGWARFLNFMTLYNPPLEEALAEYVKANRDPEEFLALQLMRIYRLGEIIWFYTNALEKTSGDLHILEQKRIQFWTEVLQSVLHNSPLTSETRTTYIKERDSLRSAEEKERQVGLH